MNIDPLTTNTLPGWKVRQHRGMIEMPPRSKLYSLAPLGMGTVEVESLTSYIQRLAWAYRVSSWVLVVQEVLPLYNGPYDLGSSPQRLGGFGRTRAMRLNGTGEVANAWVKTLEQLTGRSDLHTLTVDSWASGLPNWGFLRTAPVWCPACYQQWQEQEQPVYQPLLWALQAVTVCLHHRQPLVEQCPFCQKKQSAIGARTVPGHCTQCGRWLGMQPTTEGGVDDEEFTWQQWVTSAIEELSFASMAFGSLPWDSLAVGIDACVKAVGGTRQLGRIAGVPNVLFSNWRNRQRLPSLNYLLQVGYALDLSPLQLMTVEPERLVQILRMEWMHRHPPRIGRPASASKGDLSTIRAFLQIVLDGKAGPLPLRHVAHQLGVGEKFLAGRFPQECSQITAQYLEYRAERAKQRVMQECAEVRQAVLTLDKQGVAISRSQIAALLSNPNILRRPEGKATWQAICRERGLEP
jgi:TniQ